MKPSDPEQLLKSFLILLVISAIVLFIAKRRGFFRLPEKKIEKKLRWIHVFSLFGSIILLVFIFSLIIEVMRTFSVPFFLGNKKETHLLNGAQILLAVWLVIFLFILPKVVRFYIFFGNQKPTFSNQWKSATMGLVALAIGYPVSLLATVMMNWIVLKVFGAHAVDQVAVEHLKETAKDFGRFFPTLLVVTFVVPFFEELLFRGVLQSWLKKSMSQLGAILLTSFIFAAFHFSKRQGIGNIELIFTLFVLSCFLGFVYEREQQFIAPYVFHGAYNALNAIMVYIEIANGVVPAS